MKWMINIRVTLYILNIVKYDLLHVLGLHDCQVASTSVHLITFHTLNKAIT
jgi:hypothetical protein